MNKFYTGLEFGQYRDNVVDCDIIERKLLKEYEITYWSTDEKISIHLKHKSKQFGNWFTKNDDKLSGLILAEKWVNEVK